MDYAMRWALRVLNAARYLDTAQGGKLYQAAIAEGVLYVPGVFCYPDDATRTAPTNEMRLSYGVPSEDKIREGIARLARAIKQCL